MEYRAESETIYTACTGIEIENLSAGNYFVRYAEDNNHFEDQYHGPAPRFGRTDHKRTVDLD